MMVSGISMSGHGVPLMFFFQSMWYSSSTKPSFDWSVWLTASLMCLLGE